MRDIKFRAWDGEKMRTVFGLTPISVCYEEEAQYPVTYRKRDGIEIMQYTGLNDKNGVEIYEGDILRVWGKVRDGDEFICQMEYLESSAKFVLSGEGLLTDPWWEKKEVIGNVWENPELFKK